MNSVLILLAAATLGIETGWQPVAGGGYEYIIQIEPEMLDSLREGRDILSEIPPQLRNIRRYRITVGTGAVPRIGAPEEQRPAVQPIESSRFGAPTINRPTNNNPTSDGGSQNNSQPYNNQPYDNQPYNAQPSNTVPPAGTRPVENAPPERTATSANDLWQRRDRLFNDPAQPQPASGGQTATGTSPPSSNWPTRSQLSPIQPTGDSASQPGGATSDPSRRLPKEYSRDYGTGAYSRDYGTSPSNTGPSNAGSSNNFPTWPAVTGTATGQPTTSSEPAKSATDASRDRYPFNSTSSGDTTRTPQPASSGQGSLPYAWPPSDSSRNSQPVQNNQQPANNAPRSGSSTDPFGRSTSNNSQSGSSGQQQPSPSDRLADNRSGPVLSGAPKADTPRPFLADNTANRLANYRSTNDGHDRENESGGGNARESDEPRPWPALVGVGFLLFLSIGGNMYLGWIVYELRRQTAGLLERFKERRRAMAKGF